MTAQAPRPTALNFAHQLLVQAEEKLKLELSGTLDAARKQLDLVKDRRADDAQKAVAQLHIVGLRIKALRESLERKPAR